MQGVRYGTGARMDRGLRDLQRLGWVALFLLPAWGLVALFSRRRGGFANPEAVPVALLVLVAFQLLARRSSTSPTAARRQRPTGPRSRPPANRRPARR
jgi:hypothetical protein